MINPPTGSQSAIPSSLASSSKDSVAPDTSLPSVHSRPAESAPSLIVNFEGMGFPDFAKLTSTYEGKRIHTLELGNADMRGGAWPFLAKFLNGLPPLDTLNMTNAWIGARGAQGAFNFGKFFLEKLKAVPARMFLRDNSISSNCVIPIAAWLSVDKHVEMLDLSKNHLIAADVTTLADALSRNGTLQDLNLASNNLDTSAITALNDLLDRASSLTRLDLSGNLFTDEQKANLQQRANMRTGGPVDLTL